MLLRPRTRLLRSFKYFEPLSVKETVSLLANYGKESKILAGGTDLLTNIKMGVICPNCVININGIPNLDYIKYNENKGLFIGALSSLRSVELSKVIQEKYPALYESVHQIGTIQIRNMGTLTGNICNASPAADSAVSLLALDAQLKTMSSDLSRSIPLEDFFIGPGKTVLKSNEFVTEIQVPLLEPNTETVFIKMRRTAVDLAKINIAVKLTASSDKCEDIRIAFGSVASTPIIAKKAEEVLRGKRLTSINLEKTAKVASEETKPIDDVRSTAEWRREVSKVLVKRAIKAAQQKLERRRTN
jgi:carbon-monoxide dehydrogenase medium subunit